MRIDSTYVVMVVSGSETTVVEGLEGKVVVIVGSGAEAKILGQLVGKVVAVGISARVIAVVVVVGIGGGSTEVE